MIQTKPSIISVFLTTVLFPTVVIVLNIFLLIAIVMLIIVDFQSDIPRGVQGLAAVLLPVFFIAFINRFGPEIVLQPVGRPNVLMRTLYHPLVGFIVTVMWGMVLMLIVGNAATRTVPFAELVLSSTFMFLINNYSGAKKRQVEIYYAGVVFGFLFYIVLFGLPSQVIPPEITTLFER